MKKQIFIALMAISFSFPIASFAQKKTKKVEQSTRTEPILSQVESGTDWSTEENKNTQFWFISDQKEPFGVKVRIDSVKTFCEFRISYMEALNGVATPPPVKLFAVKIASRDTIVIPINVYEEGGYDFSKDSPEKIRNYVKKMLGLTNPKMKESCEWFSNEMAVTVFLNK